jgi:phage gp29-like protein
VADQILLNCRRVVGQEPSQIPEEQEFIVFMQNTWEQARDDGRMEEAARSVLTALRVRGIEVPDAARKRILAEKDRERLERWLERAILASSIVDVLNVPS